MFGWRSSFYSLAYLFPSCCLYVLYSHGFHFQNSIFCCLWKCGASPFSQPRPPKTYKIGFWMRKYGSMSWKRTWVWSSSNRIHELDLGPLTTDEKKKSKTLTTRYRDSKGLVKFKGSSSLKPSQRLRLNYFAWRKLGLQKNNLSRERNLPPNYA